MRSRGLTWAVSTAIRQRTGSRMDQQPDPPPCRKLSNLPFPLIRSTSTSLSRPSTSSGGAWMSGEPPRLFGVEPPKPRIRAVRIVDMSGSNAWAEFAGIFARTRAAYLDHEQAKTELKTLMPEDAKEAIGHGVRAKRSKSGAHNYVGRSFAGGGALGDHRRWKVGGDHP